MRMTCVSGLDQVRLFLLFLYVCITATTTSYPNCVFIEFSVANADGACGSAAMATIGLTTADVIECLAIRCVICAYALAAYRCGHLDAVRLPSAS